MDGGRRFFQAVRSDGDVGGNESECGREDFEAAQGSAGSPEEVNFHKIIWEDHFPLAYAIGISLEEFEHMTPTELGYCLKGYEMRRKMQDRAVWEYFGTYGLSAVMTAVEHCLAGSKAVSKYIEKPNLQDGTLQSRPLTEEEKMLEVDKFFAQEEARRINWRRTHRKKMEQQGGDVS